MRAGYSIALMALLAAVPAAAQTPAAPRAFPTSDAPFKTRIEVNRWHGYDELVADMERLQRAFPKFLTLSSIGKSVEGRDIKVMTILNPDTGAEATKAGMYVEANVHGNEIQGAEVCLYT
ncbi:MAG: M14 family zinc carboxypeptidase, partial [Vicinamibacteria bacterium]